MSSVDRTASLKHYTPLGHQVSAESIPWASPRKHCCFVDLESCWLSVPAGRVSTARSAEFLLPRQLSELVLGGMELGAADDAVSTWLLPS